MRLIRHRTPRHDVECPNAFISKLPSTHFDISPFPLGRPPSGWGNGTKGAWSLESMGARAPFFRKFCMAFFLSTVKKKHAFRTRHPPLRVYHEPALCRSCFRLSEVQLGRFGHFCLTRDEKSMFFPTLPTLRKHRCGRWSSDGEGEKNQLFSSVSQRLRIATSSLPAMYSAC